MLTTHHAQEEEKLNGERARWCPLQAREEDFEQEPEVTVADRQDMFKEEQKKQERQLHKRKDISEKGMR